ncbi:hypothetical protein MMC11_000043 [Xylographa trunciseda]|nr:hypothetical protein [Xylographa trunciseda]
MSDASSQVAGPSHPKPLVIQPSKTHTHTIILLHGLSTDGISFGTDFLKTAINGRGHTLPQAFPHVRFVFPSGAPRKCTALGGKIVNAWFDVSSIADRTLGEEEQVEGLRESTIYLCKLIGEETAILERLRLGSGHLALWGFSQGCAMGIWVLLSGGSKLGAFVGMSGWLPFRRQIDEAMNGEEDQSVRRMRAIDYMKRAVPGCPTSENHSAFFTPAFLGHGILDIKVRTQWGEEMRNSMKVLGMDVTWKAYEALEHWYEVPLEIDDIAQFLQSKGFEP